MSYNIKVQNEILFLILAEGMKHSEPDILMGSMDTEDLKLEVLLGVWKPLVPKVCDWPLAVLDAKTLDEDHTIPNRYAKSLGFHTFHNIFSGIKYSPKQKWYYHSFQSEKEVLVFHQYSKGKFFANAHGSFFNRNCPEDTKPRISVEMRVALFF